MPEHFHLLISEPEKANPSVIIQALKLGVARRILTARKRHETQEAEQEGLWLNPVPQHIWQARFYDYNVWGARKRVEKLRYIHRNPAIIVAQQVTTQAADNRSLLPMAEAAKQALGTPETLNVVADAGYSNGEQAERCESQGIVPHAPANRAINNQGDGTLFDRRLFVYEEKPDTFRCPAGQTLGRRQLSRKDRGVMYAAEAQICGACVMKNRCTSTSRRWVTRHLHEGALQRMNQRATAKLMRLRRCTVERPFAVLKHVILGNARFLLRGSDGAQIEISLATLAYNLKP